MSKRKLGAFTLGVMTVVAGGVLARYVHDGAGMALIGAGAYWFGLLTRQPRFMAKDPPPG